MLDNVILTTAHEHNEYGPSPILKHDEWMSIYENYKKELASIEKRYERTEKFLFRVQKKLKIILEKQHSEVGIYILQWTILLYENL